MTQYWITFLSMFHVWLYWCSYLHLENTTCVDRVKHTHLDYSDRLRGYHMMQYSCGYCRFRLAVPLRVPWSYCDSCRACSSCKVPSKVLQSHSGAVIYETFVAGQEEYGCADYGIWQMRPVITQLVDTKARSKVYTQSINHVTNLVPTSGSQICPALSLDYVANKNK